MIDPANSPNPRQQTPYQEACMASLRGNITTLQDIESIREFLPLFFTDTSFIQNSVVLPLGRLLKENEKVREIIEPFLKDPDPSVRACILHLAGYAGENGKFYEPEILQGLEHPSAEVRYRAVQAACRLEITIPENLIEGLMKDSDKRIVELTLEFPKAYPLGETSLLRNLEIHPPAGIEWLKTVEEIHAVGGDCSDFVPSLMELRKDEDPEKSWIACHILYKIIPNDETRDTLAQKTPVALMHYLNREPDVPTPISPTPPKTNKRGGLSKAEMIDVLRNFKLSEKLKDLPTVDYDRISEIADQIKINNEELNRTLSKAVASPDPQIAGDAILFAEMVSFDRPEQRKMLYSRALLKALQTLSSFDNQGTEHFSDDRKAYEWNAIRSLYLLYPDLPERGRAGFKFLVQKVLKEKGSKALFEGYFG